MSGLSSGVEYICQVDFGFVASAKSIMGLNVGPGLFSELNDGVESTPTLPAGVELDCWCQVSSKLDCWCWVDFRLWLLVPGQLRALKMEC